MNENMFDVPEMTGHEEPRDVRFIGCATHPRPFPDHAPCSVCLRKDAKRGVQVLKAAADPQTDPFAYVCADCIGHLAVALASPT